MKRIVTIAALALISYCSNSISMPHGHNGKATQEQQEAAAQVHQDYLTLAQELANPKPNSAAVAVIGGEIAENLQKLPTEQKVALGTQHAATNKRNAEFLTKKQQKLAYLSQEGDKVVRLLTLVTTGPEGACSGSVITGFIKKGVRYYRKAIQIDCDATPAFVPTFYNLLKNSRIAPFATAGLQA